MGTSRARARARPFAALRLPDRFVEVVFGDLVAFFGCLATRLVFVLFRVAAFDFGVRCVAASSSTLPVAIMNNTHTRRAIV